MSLISYVRYWEILFVIIIKHCLIVCMPCISGVKSLHLCFWKLSWSIQSIWGFLAFQMANSCWSAILLTLIFCWCSLLTCWKYISTVSGGPIDCILTIHKINVIFSFITASLPKSSLFLALSILWTHPCIILSYKSRSILTILWCCYYGCIISWPCLWRHPLFIVFAKPLGMSHIFSLNSLVILCILAFYGEISLLLDSCRCRSSIFDLSCDSCVFGW